MQVPRHSAAISETDPNTIAHNTSNTRYDAIICGAGPVGLFLACELALAACSVVVLEREEFPRSPFKRLPFGIRGLSTPSIEALDRRGLLSELTLHRRLKNPHQSTTPEGPGRQRGHFAGIPFLEGNVDPSQWSYRLPGSTATSLMTELEELESVLARRAERLGVTIRRGAAVSSCYQTGEQVTVGCGDQVFHGKYLVGCDGGRSVVRKASAFDFAGTDPEFTGYSIQADFAAEKLELGRVLTATGMYFQSQPGYLVMVEFDGGKGHLAEPVTKERVQTVLRRVSDTTMTIDTLHAATTWTDRARQSTCYRKGRVLLAGDAAHIHSPLGGQGLNLGLGDAMNLGWKLAATLQDRAPQGLLDTYQAERHPLGAEILNWSRAQVAIMKPDPASRALYAIVRDLIATRDGATYIAGRVWGVCAAYDPGCGHPLVGHSVPNFECEGGAHVGDLMHDGQGILLDFENEASLRALASECKGRLKYVTSRANERFGLKAALIRPDGIIAWCCGNEMDSSEFRKAASRWFAGR